MSCAGFKFWGRAIAPLCLCLCLCFCFSVVGAKRAIASVHIYPESSTQVMYRSQQSLRDAQDQAWQAVLFKRMKQGELDSLHLRLIGFPGRAALTHPQVLRMTTGDGRVLTAPDVSDQAPQLVNLGEYDFLEVLTRLEQDPPLRLSLPLKGGRVVDLLVPPFVVREWHQVWQATSG